MTFDVLADIIVGLEHGWSSIYEACCRCRRCNSFMIKVFALRKSDQRENFRSSGAMTSAGSDLSCKFYFKRDIFKADTHCKPAPEDLPKDIKDVFVEATRCLAAGCLNAASTMFRLCLDLATKGLLPAEGNEHGPSKHERRNLSPRLRWLFSQNLLPSDLQEISYVVKDHGDEGAHDGSLGADDAEDIYDFAFLLLQRLYSEPARLRAARMRIVKRGTPEI